MYVLKTMIIPAMSLNYVIGVRVCNNKIYALVQAVNNYFILEWDGVDTDWFVCFTVETNFNIPITSIEVIKWLNGGVYEDRIALYQNMLRTDGGTHTHGRLHIMLLDVSDVDVWVSLPAEMLVSDNVSVSIGDSVFFIGYNNFIGQPPPGGNWSEELLEIKASEEYAIIHNCGRFHHYPCPSGFLYGSLSLQLLDLWNVNTLLVMSSRGRMGKMEICVGNTLEVLPLPTTPLHENDDITGFFSVDIPEYDPTQSVLLWTQTMETLISNDASGGEYSWDFTDEKWDPEHYAWTKIIPFFFNDKRYVLLSDQPGETLLINSIFEVSLIDGKFVLELLCVDTLHDMPKNHVKFTRHDEEQLFFIYNNGSVQVLENDIVEFKLQPVAIVGEVSPIKSGLASTFGYIDWIPPLVERSSFQYVLDLFIEQFKRKPITTGLTSVVLSLMEDFLDVVVEFTRCRDIETIEGQFLLAAADLLGVDSTGKSESDLRSSVKFATIYNGSGGEPESIIALFKELTKPYYMEYTELYPAKIEVFYRSNYLPTPFLVDKMKKLVGGGIGFSVILSLDSLQAGFIEYDGEPPREGVGGLGEDDEDIGGGHLAEQIF